MMSGVTGVRSEDVVSERVGQSGQDRRVSGTDGRFPDAASADRRLGIGVFSAANFT